MKVFTPLVHVTRTQRVLIAIALICVLTTLVIGTVLATGMSVKPKSGARDNGNDVQTPFNVSGDLLDSGTFASWQAPRAYWDTPDANNPDSAYEIGVPGSATVDPDGGFNFDLEIPLYDNNVSPVRPGTHKVTVCATGGHCHGRPHLRQRELQGPGANDHRSEQKQWTARRFRNGQRRALLTGQRGRGDLDHVRSQCRVIR